MNRLFLCFLIGIIVVGCEPPKEKSQNTEKERISIEIPEFDADSAYFFIHL
jgi:hypothetical protein